MTPVTPAASGIQVKICGLTRPKEALACARLGAAAIGLVFHRKSPRHLSIPVARSIAVELPPEIRPVGVFVNLDYDTIMEHVDAVGLWGVQLHGQEPPELVARLKGGGTKVFKALFRNGTPPIASAAAYDPSAFLVESGVGPLPGGNAESWDWSDAGALSARFPVVLAGGLAADNVARAASGARADAVDVSSGVEDRPGVKNLDRVAAFMAAVSRLRPTYRPRRIF